MAVAALLVLIGRPSSAQPADAGAARVSDRILAALVEANGVPGMAASVWRDGRVVWTGVAGYQDLEARRPVDGSTIFRLASVSKVFAAAAAARLREQGRLDVDAPVQDLVEYLPNRWPVITSAQLAAHTSGIPHYQAVDDGRGSRRFASVREAVEVFQDRELLFAPGARYSYSSWGYTLLSAVVEARSGERYLDYLAREITPGLTIVADPTDTAEPRASRAYEFAGGTVRRAAPHDYSYGWGGAGLASTAPDLARFGGRLLTGEVVSRETLEWMMVPARLANDSAASAGDYRVGFGLRVATDPDGNRIAHHAGVTSGARSALVLYPDRALAVGVLSNALWVSAIEQTAMMLAAPFGPGVPGAAVPCPLAATGYEGSYDARAISGTARVRQEDGLCVAEISVRNAFGEMLNGYPQQDAETVILIGLDARGGFQRSALVTPIGVYDLRVQQDGSYAAALGGSRRITLRFRAR